MLTRTVAKLLVVISRKFSKSGIFRANNHCGPIMKTDSGLAGMTEVGQGFLSSNVALPGHSTLRGKGLLSDKLPFNQLYPFVFYDNKPFPIKRAYSFFVCFLAYPKQAVDNFRPAFVGYRNKAARCF